MRWVLLCLLFLGCRNTSSPPPKEPIIGRSGVEIYRATIPSDWERVSIKQSDDTTLPIAEFRIGDVSIWVHTFPDRIPPRAQTLRWDRQLIEQEPYTKSITPYAHGGFAGERFEGIGKMKGERVKVLAFALQLDPEFYSRLAGSERGYDYTIKAVGPPDEFPDLEIEQFARSFELLEAIQ